jgi:hypothetical protein
MPGEFRPLVLPLRFGKLRQQISRQLLGFSECVQIRLKIAV